MKKMLFQQEMSLGNRWLVAKAVLTKVPSFCDDKPDNLIKLKALASRCLVKDLDTRLQLVDWNDFALTDVLDPRERLKSRLGKSQPCDSTSRLEFDRNESIRRVIDMVRGELLQICDTKLMLTIDSIGSSNTYIAKLNPMANWSVDVYADMCHIDHHLSLLIKR